MKHNTLLKLFKRVLPKASKSASLFLLIGSTATLWAGIGQVKFATQLDGGVTLEGQDSIQWRGLTLEEGQQFEVILSFIDVLDASEAPTDSYTMELVFADGQSVLIDEVNEGASASSSELDGGLNYLSQNYQYSSADENHLLEVSYGSGDFYDTDFPELLPELKLLAQHDTDRDSIVALATKLAAGGVTIDFDGLASAELPFASLDIVARSATKLRFPSAEHLEDGLDEEGLFSWFWQEGLGSIASRDDFLYLFEEDRWLYTLPLAEPGHSIDENGEIRCWETGMWSYDFSLESWVWIGGYFHPNYYNDATAQWETYE